MVIDAGVDTTGRDCEASDAAGHDTAGQDGPRRSTAKPRDGAAGEKPDPRKLALDWITLWQSELSAMAADPEIHESWQIVVALWAGTMSTMLHGIPCNQNTTANDAARERSRPADAPRPASAAAAPDPRDAEIERLARHVSALERRLVELERSSDPPVHSNSRSGRTRRR